MGHAWYVFLRLKLNNISGQNVIVGTFASIYLVIYFSNCKVIAKEGQQGNETFDLKCLRIVIPIQIAYKQTHYNHRWLVSQPPIVLQTDEKLWLSLDSNQRHSYTNVQG